VPAPAPQRSRPLPIEKLAARFALNVNHQNDPVDYVLSEETLSMHARR
jgi:hypothetical protein